MGNLESDVPVGEGKGWRAMALLQSVFRWGQCTGPRPRSSLRVSCQRPLLTPVFSPCVRKRGGQLGEPSASCYVASSSFSASGMFGFFYKSESFSPGSHSKSFGLPVRVGHVELSPVTVPGLFAAQGEQHGWWEGVCTRTCTPLVRSAVRHVAGVGSELPCTRCSLARRLP